MFRKNAFGLPETDTGFPETSLRVEFSVVVSIVLTVKIPREIFFTVGKEQ